VLFQDDLARVVGRDRNAAPGDYPKGTVLERTSDVLSMS
jgi:hypothetical protein